MSEQTDTAGTDAETDVDPSAAISRGVGLSMEAVTALADDSPAGQAVASFKDVVERYKAAEAEYEALKAERNAAVYDLKAKHNIGFSALAEIMGVTSSLVLYLYERAQGKTAKQIREESIASRKAKELTRETDPDRKPARKQTPEEKAFRKQQRDALRAFLEEQKARAAERGEDTSAMDAGLADADAEQAADDAEG